MIEADPVAARRIRWTLAAGAVVLVVLVGLIGVRALRHDGGPHREHHHGFVTTASSESVCLNEGTDRQPRQVCAANHLGFVPRVGNQVDGIAETVPLPLCRDVPVENGQCADQLGALVLAWTRMDVTT